MIRILDASILAFTKLRTRKVRTIVTVLIASLLFSGLVAASLIFAGAVSSAERFTQEGLTKRFISSVTYFSNSEANFPPDSVKKRATELRNQTIADKKKEAKRLGIEYDPATEPALETPDGYGGTYYNAYIPPALKAMQEYTATQPTQLDKLKQDTAKYKPLKIYELKHSSIDGAIKPIKDGKEDFKNEPIRQYTADDTPGVTQGWAYIDASITKPFLLEESAIKAQPDQTSLPVIAPYAKAEEALGLKKLPKTAQPSERLERIRYIRAHAGEARLVGCYRNAASQQLIDSAVDTAKEIEKNKKNKDYIKPDLIYSLPAQDSCGPAVITRDVRTKEEKTATAKDIEFRKIFGEYAEPVQQKITFRIVGLAPDPVGFDDFLTVSALVSTIAGSSLQGQWVVPLDYYNALPNKADYEKFFPGNATNTSVPSFHADSYLVEFATTAQTRAFSDASACFDNCGGEKPFVMPFGSNSILLEDITKGTMTVLGIAALIVMAIAGLIMLGMIGRVISDSRRETAVFRAIGAKKSDIATIYTIYTLMLSGLVAVSALVIGTGLALWADSQWSGSATVQAHLSFIGVQENEVFRLIDMWWLAIGAIVAAVLVAGLISMLFPLGRNLARSPLKDMRDDT